MKEVRARVHLPNDSSAGQRPYKGRERRTRATPPDEVEPVVLTRKLAEVINGIDLSESSVGDRLPLGRWEAEVLIAEGWAEPTTPEQRRRSNGR